MLKLFALSLVHVVESQALQLASCDGHALWITVPVKKTVVQSWLDEHLQPADKGKVVLDSAPGYSDTHPVQIEWDSFHSCKSVGSPIPYPSFDEVATMIPYVRWQNQTEVHFQPWSIVNNVWGAAAMILTGSRHATQISGDSEYPDAPGNWSQWLNAQGSSVLSLRDVVVEDLRNASSLAAEDKNWREMLSLKHTKSVTYDRCAAHGGAWTYSCNTIQWDVKQAQEIVTGELDTTQGSTHYFATSLKGDISDLRKRLPGFAAYAVHSSMKAIIGCEGDSQIVV